MESRQQKACCDPDLATSAGPVRKMPQKFRSAELSRHISGWNCSVSTRPLVAVLDYGIGNLHSAQKALERGGADAHLTADPGLIADAAGVVLPGVGAFGACMDALRGADLEAPVHAAVDSGRPFLGICVGMQMLFTNSEEDDHAAGLDVIPGTVKWIPAGPKIPQMQWNRLDIKKPDDPMMQQLGDGPYVYFVHSLHGVPMGQTLSPPRSSTAPP